MPLQKIAEIKICDDTYDLAKNGRYALVKPGGVDAYGRPVADHVNLYDWISRHEQSGGERVNRVQALLDLLGDALSRLQAQRDTHLRNAEGE